VMSGDGAGALQGPTHYSTGSSPLSVAVGDVNNDGIKDLVTANQGSNDVSVLLGNADGTFQAGVSYGAGTGPTAVAIGDMNSDGRPDLAVTNNGGVTMLLGFGDGSFQSMATYVSGSNPAAVAVADFNGDSAPDLAVANAGDNSASVLLNDGDWTTPLASISGPSRAAPNQTLTFTLKAVGGGLPANTTFTFDIDWNGDGTVDQTVDGVSGTTVTHAFATAGNYTTKLIATDPANHSNAAATHDIQVTIPLATIAGPSAGARNQTLTFTLNAAEDGLPASTIFTFDIDWNGDGTVDQTVNGLSGTTVTHAFASAGSFTSRLTATDPFNIPSAVATHDTQVLSVSVTIGDDPCDATKKALFIDGTSAGETIVLSPGAGNSVAVSIGGVSVGSVTAPGGAAFGSIIVHAGSGDDIVRLMNSLNVSAFVFGEDGADTLDASGSIASNVLVGGAGSDTLTGGSGNDVLIGGSGTDTVLGNGGDDILIGGTTNYDANLTALCAILDEWSQSGVSYSTRVSDLKGGKGKNSGGGLNAPYFLTTSTVTDDGAIDTLTGDGGLDWFFARSKGTAKDITDKSSGETLTSL